MPVMGESAEVGVISDQVFLCIRVFKCSVSPSTGGPHCRLFSVSSSIASLFPFVVLPLALLGLR